MPACQPTTEDLLDESLAALSRDRDAGAWRSDISQRMMTLKLRLLERDGLVARRVTPDVPPRVEYELTPLGLGAYRGYLSVLHWSEQATPAIRAARAVYDAQHADGATLCQAAEREA